MQFRHVLAALTLCVPVAALPVPFAPAPIPAPLQGSPQTPTAEAYLKAGNPGITDYFSSALAVSGNTVAVSAISEDGSVGGIDPPPTSGLSSSGAVYVFVEEAGGWTQQAFIKAPAPDVDDGFGNSIALHEDTLVVGCSRDDSADTTDPSDNSLSASGSVFVYVRNDGVWSLQAQLKAGVPAEAEFFGMAVAVHDDTIVVGSAGEDSSASGVDGDESLTDLPSSGAAWVFRRSGVSWTQTAFLKASHPDVNDLFGETVDVWGDTIVVGASGDDSATSGVDGDPSDDSAFNRGSVTVFRRTGLTWSQEAYLQAADGDDFDGFGRTVALHRDTLAVGASNEQSAASGVNGDQSDDSLEDAGAAYVFHRAGAQWSQQAYVKSFVPDAGDHFGGAFAVDVHEDVLLVGAGGDDSASSGLGGSPGDDSLEEAGGAFLYVREDGAWSPRLYLKASAPDAGDVFGDTAALGGRFAVVGALLEDSAASGVDGDDTDDSLGSSGAAYVFRLGPWFDEGCALPGEDEDPQLFGSGTLVPGTPCALTLTNAAPNALVAAFQSFVSSPTSFRGGTLKAFPYSTLLYPTTSSGGELVLPFTLPVGVPSGFPFWVQFAIADDAAILGASLSNAVRGEIP